jgi:prevent-host-death family protein
MRTHPFHKARAALSDLVDRALAGEPQRVTRHGKEAVVIVSESEWEKRRPKYANLGELLADFAMRHGFDDDMFDRSGFQQTRPLGADFLRDDD